MNQSIPKEIPSMTETKRPRRGPTRRAAFAGLLVLPLTARSAESLPADTEVLEVRERVWRDWFAGNRQALLEVLPADFVGIGAGGGVGQTRAETIASSQAFAGAGSKLTNLAFTDNQIQRLGNVTIIYCGFTFTTQDKAGSANTVTGRATEVFLRSGSKWLHPGWHLDSGK
jgi:ketosteroid isomerase-like protein